MRFALGAPLLGTVALLGALAAGRHGLAIAQPPTAPPDHGCWIRGERADLELRISPLDSAIGRLGDDEIKVCYSRPRALGRPIMGRVVPFGEPWRFGANEATTIHLTVALSIGDVVLAPGVYSLYAIPGPRSWHIVVNDSTSRWGIPIDSTVRAHDVGAFSVPVERTETPVEMFTIRLQPTAEDGQALVAEWERTRVRLIVQRQ